MPFAEQVRAGPRSACGRSTRPSCRRASSRTRPRMPVERTGRRVIVIDSLNGYLNAMPEERFLTLQLHELLTYLGQQGVTTILVVAQHGLIGQHESARRCQLPGRHASSCSATSRCQARCRKAISVLKKRGGPHEDTIRELRLTAARESQIGEPLREFQGVSDRRAGVSRRGAPAGARPADEPEKLPASASSGCWCWRRTADAALSRRDSGRGGPAVRALRRSAGAVRGAPRGAGAALLTEEALAAEPASGAARRPRKPARLVRVAVRRADRAWLGLHARRLHTLGNVILLDRPVRVADPRQLRLRTALRARARQYQIREQLRVAGGERICAPGGGPAQGRVPGDAGPRAAQSARRRSATPWMSCSGCARRPGRPGRVQRMRRPAGARTWRVWWTTCWTSRGSPGARSSCAREPLDLTRLVREVCDDERAALEEAGLTVHLDLPETPITLDGDPTRLRAGGCNNLLQNAAKFTDSGRSKWVFRCSGVQVFRQATSKASPSTIDPEHLNARTPERPNARTPERLNTHCRPRRARHGHRAVAGDAVAASSSRSSRRGRERERSQGGLGLGLALVKGWVTMHGGAVRAESEGSGAGTTMVIRLPMAATTPDTVR